MSSTKLLRNRSYIKPFSWLCPHCSRNTTITENDMEVCQASITIDKDPQNNSITQTVVNVRIYLCPNEACKKHSVEVHEFYEKTYTNGRGVHLPSRLSLMRSHQLYPEQNVKKYPDYIPKAILDDYRESVLTREVSPKASATLSRRCLQGIIRDFWKVKPANLANEIDQIKGKVDSITWDAIDATRKIGNVGAHMEKDVNTIIEVDSKEAEMLNQLIETLIENWYVQTHERNKRLKELKSVADKKKP